MEKFCVYKHTTPNGKVYIGITCQNPEKRWRNGNGYRNNKYFYNAIKKYKWENIKHEILLEDISKEEACEKEKEFIELFQSNKAGFGYNNSIGGECGTLGAKLSKETIEKIKKSHTGSHLSEEAKKKLSEQRKGEKNPNFGKRPSEETLEKLRKAAKLKWLDEEYRNKMLVILKEANSSPERRRKLSEKSRGENNYWYGKHGPYCGKDHPNYGKHLTKDQKEYLSFAMSKPVVCVETDTIFPSAKFASAFFGVQISAVSKAVGRSNKTSCGYHWIFYNGDD